MFRELMRAVFTAGLPVFITTYALVSWALKSDHLGRASSLKEMKKELKRHSKKKADEKARNKSKHQKVVIAQTNSTTQTGNRKTDVFHNKWLAFGGGFYGVVGLLTYAIVELAELRDFVIGFDSFSSLISQLGFDMLINLFIDAVMNFVVAIAWPAYWLAEIRGQYVWAWLLVAYAAYWAGANLAMQRANART